MYHITITLPTVQFAIAMCRYLQGHGWSTASRDCLTVLVSVDHYSQVLCLPIDVLRICEENGITKFALDYERLDPKNFPLN